MKSYHCPFEVLIDIVSGKWKMENANFVAIKCSWT